MNDTPEDIEIKYREMLFSRSPAERLRMASSMFDSARTLATAGILAEQPGVTPGELRAKLFLRFYGSDFPASECQRILSKLPAMSLDSDAT